MKVQWLKLFFKLTVWLAVEITLNLIGLDDMADYGEFIFDHGNFNLIQFGAVSCVVMEV